MVRDHHQDTLLYAGEVKLRLTDWFFFRDAITLKYVGLQDATVKLQRSDSTWNYRFLEEYFASPSTGDSAKPVNFALERLSLNNINVLKKDGWRGEDVFLHLRSLQLSGRKWDLAKKEIDLNRVSILEPFFSVYQYQGNRPKRPVDTTYIEPVFNDSTLKWNPEGWKLTASEFIVQGGTVKASAQTKRNPYYYFDSRNILFTNLNSTFTNIRLSDDTVFARLNLQTDERSGFKIRSLKADLAMDPQGMVFNNLDIRTNKSHLSNYFAMRYQQFDDMSDFVEKVRMDGRLIDSEIDSDDIAFFAPELKDLKKKIQLSGAVVGSVSNLSTKNMELKAGKSTVLIGDLKIVGLPDISKTFIDFKSNDFRTTYADAIAFFPNLKKINDPRLDRLGFLKFKGYFTGFITDFITSGFINTGLGDVSGELYLKIPDKGLAVYNGKITTSGFNIGQLLAYEALGKISFQGDVKGNGFNLRGLTAELDGKVKYLDFNDYRYSNLKIKATLAKRLFNGDLIANDTNLHAKLNGLIDFRQATPKFDFTANIDQSNLKRLKLYKEDIDFNGQVLFNFTGATIDSFLGAAKIYDASVYRDGQRLSFDSLVLESSIFATDRKSVKVSSNEFEALLLGDFSIKDLPNAFQLFLNRYFPSYILPPTQSMKNEKFSFTVATRKVDDYLSLIDKNLRGLNYTNLSGRINLEENIFDLDTEIPAVSYKNIDFSNIDIKARGNLDSLQVSGNVGDIFVNDSLHFPGTSLTISSSRDLSKVDIHTSANQTLSSANISGLVQTLKNGVRITFNPSDFDINGKKWIIDKNGELVLSRDLVTMEGVRIYQEDQEIFITAGPSDIGNSNDLKITLKKINIGDFAPFLTRDYRLEGLLSGNADIADPLGNMVVNVNAQTQYFRLDNDSLGKVDINASYSKNTGKIDTKISSDNPNYNFDMNGMIDLLDSAKQALDLNFALRNADVHIISRYLTGIFSRVSGFGSGDLRIVGPARDLKYLGQIKLRDAGLMVDYTKCYYLIPDANLTFSDGAIGFGSFTLRDTLGNVGEVVNGRLDHQGFKDMAFDFNIKSNRLLLLNTTAADNSQFYGSVIGKVSMSLTGPMEDMRMDIKGEPTDTSNIYLPIGSSRESGDAGFIVWKVYGREMKDADLKRAESNLSVSLDLTANHFANVFVILDPLTGDIIAANGNGNLKIRAGTNEDMTMSGRFNIERGNYNFTFQSIKRNFKLREDAGSYISWNGDPTNATINIEAEYEAENVRFSDLLNGSSIAKATTNEDIKRYRGKVLVIAELTEKLTKPNIAFRIELPANSPIRSSPDVATIFSFIENDINELNKQVSFLIVFNTFGPYTGGSNGSGTGDLANKAFEGIVVNSISGFLSNILTNQFSNILQ
ncbi:MAG: translocation/assembly module TamB domain-containing protein, partial [Chitinophagaceae bacterium]